MNTPKLGRTRQAKARKLVYHVGLLQVGHTDTGMHDRRCDMTKKHFIALANTIKSHNRDFPTNAFSSHQIAALAHYCLIQNPRFNRERWLAYIAGECGPNGGNLK